MDINFLINRLKRMSVKEIIYRINQKRQSVMEKMLVNIYNFDTKIIEDGCNLFSHDLELIDKDLILKNADKLCNNIVDIFASKDVDLGNKINYHKDYISGLCGPKDVFGKSINYRDSKKIGDIKYIWELNRHLFLLTLAQAYYISKDNKYLDKFKYYLEEWFEQNKFLYGVNWSSTMEQGVRLINWTFCWHLLKDSLEDEFKNRWMKSIYQHSWYIEKNLSAYSSANNHLIGEVAGLFIASIALPKFKKSKKWQKKAYDVLVQECFKQNYEDGVNKEQAVSYQQFVLDFLLLSYLVGKINGVEFPKDYFDRLEKMAEYISVIEDIEGNIPQIGDEDDGCVIDVGQKEYGVYRSLLNTSAYVFNRTEFIKSNSQLDNKTRLMLNIAKLDVGKLHLVSKELPVKFEKAGYYILGSNLGKENEEKMIFDCGPLGYLAIAAHGHADALSFYFSAAGCPIFIDPGTFVYHTNKKWRNYFRSSRAHNTITVDGKDQSEICGNFMWSNKANSQLLKYTKLSSVKAKHDGYLRLDDPVEHIREIIKSENEWEIIDELKCKGQHSIELNFHLHDKCQVTFNDGIFNIAFEKGRVLLYIPNGFDYQIVKGDEETPLGWYSKSFHVKCETNTLRFVKEISGSELIRTKFKTEIN